MFFQKIATEVTVKEINYISEKCSKWTQKGLNDTQE